MKQLELDVTFPSFLFFFSFILSNFVTVIPNDKFPTSERGGQDEKREITVKVLTRKLDDRFINVADHFLSLVRFFARAKTLSL